MSLVPYNPTIGDILVIASGARYEFDGATFFYLDGGVAGDPATLNYNLPVSLATVLLDYTKVASQVEVDAGLVDNKAVTPLTLKSETNRVTGLIPTDAYYDARYLSKLERANNSLMFNGKTEAQFLSSIAAHVHPDVTTTVAGFMSFTDKVKLDSINVALIGGATDAFLLDRTNHTGTQATSTVTGLDALLLSKAGLTSPNFTGIPTAPTPLASTNTSQIATTAFVQGLLTAHIHPQSAITGLVGDLALKAPLLSPILTGTPEAPTAAGSTNTDQLASTAFVQQELGTYAAPLVHTHPQTDVTNLVADLALKAPLASPALTGTPTVPTAVAATNTTQAASTAFVQQEVASLINGAPGVLDTLDELAAAMGDDSNFATTMTNALALKADLASPTLTGVPLSTTAITTTNTTQIATTAFVQQELLATSAPLVHTHVMADITDLAPALLLKADLTSPSFTGTPVAPTAVANTNTTQLATTAFVQTEITDLIAGAPATLDTLNELAAAINDDPAFSTTITTAINLKADIASPTFTGVPVAPTAVTTTNTTQLATTAFVQQELLAVSAPLVHTHVMADITDLAAALLLKADLASPSLTGTPLAPTAVADTNTTQIATTQYVQTELTDLIAGAPVGLDTLNELAAAINDDPAFSTTITTAINLKADIASPALTGVPTAPTAALAASTTQLATTEFVRNEFIANPVAITGVKDTKTANYTVVTADRSKILVANSATPIAFTFPLSTTTGSDWVVTVLNTGAGDLTLTPSGGNLIDGLSNIIVPTDSSRMITSDGVTNLRSIFTGGGPEIDLRTEYLYIATPAQTVFTGLDSNGQTLSYEAGLINVHLNGVLLQNVVEYIAINGTDITLTTGALVGDVLTIEAFTTSTISNVYTQPQVDAALNLKYDKTGGIISGLPIVDTGGDSALLLNANASGNWSANIFRNSNIDRWFAGSIGAEGGANSGSNYDIYRYDDAGVFLGTSLSINRATGIVNTPDTPAFSAFSGGIPPATTGVFQAGSNDGGGPIMTVLNVGNHYNIATGRFTAPVAGRYSFNMSISADSNGATGHIRLWISLNGVAVTPGALSYLTAWNGRSEAIVLQLAAGDFVSGTITYSNIQLADIWASSFSGFLVS